MRMSISAFVTDHLLISGGSVYNHYQRITPPSTPPSIPTREAPTAGPSDQSYTTLESNQSSASTSNFAAPTPSPSSSSRSRRNTPDIDLHRAGIELDGGIVRFTKDPDPTLTHDIITERSREGRYGKLHGEPSLA